MKRFLQIFSLLLLTSMAYSQSQRLVFIEEFTQASCPPCEVTTPALNQIIAANADKIIQLRYQVWWPGYDPMFLDNEAEVQTRVQYYGVGGVPAVFADGTEEAQSGVLPQTTINARYGTSAPIKMEVSHSLSSDLTTADITIKITNEGNSAYNIATNKLRVAIIEEDITYPFPPGSTSLQVFEAVMKKFVTGAEGIEIPSIEAGATWEKTWAGEPLPEAVYDYNKLAIVAFVQNDDDKSVANAGYSEPKELSGYPDLAIENKSEVTGGYCEYGFIPKVTVINDGSIPVESFTVSLFINGEEKATKEVTATLNQGATTDVIMDEIDLPPGNSEINYVVLTPIRDIAVLNNYTDFLTAGKIGNVIPSYANGFEDVDLGAVPANAIVDRPFSGRNFVVLTGDALNAAEPIGGYGLSDKSVAINFWNWDPAAFTSQGFMIIADQYVVTEGAKLKFDWAYTTWQGSADRLKIQISEDCGKTFKDLFNKAGSALKTAPELNANDAFFIPLPAEWKSSEHDLKAYVGKTVVIRALVTSAWGDMLYLDNINITGGTTDVNDLTTGETLEVNPNPATANTTFEFNLATASDVSYTVTDALGKLIENKNLGNTSGKFNHSFDVSDYKSGLYFVNFQLGERQVVKRLMVIH